MLEDGFIARRLTQLRMQRGCSARDMSLSLGQSESYINKIENGHTLPSLMGLAYICEYFGITPAEFLEGGDPMPEQLRLIISDLKMLDTDTLSHIAALVKDLLNKKR